MRVVVALILPLLFSGCVYFSDRGAGLSQYPDCKEGYNAAGEYYHECEEGFISYKK
jgi:hypothetical protein